jgi:hypothetical protein
MTPKFTRFFSTDSAKAVLANKYGVLNGINYAAPHDTGGAGNMCRHSTQGCRDLCLGMYSGQASMVSDLENGMNNVRLSRINKIKYMTSDMAGYMSEMSWHIDKLQRQARRKGLDLVIRPNGSTDTPYERIRVGEHRNIMEAHPDVQFDDYTKNYDRMWTTMPRNYHLVYSRSEKTEISQMQRLIDAGKQVAVVFAVRKKDPLPTVWNGMPVVDGDKHDLIHLQPRGVILGLRPKGRKAWADDTGFVVRNF